MAVHKLKNYKAPRMDNIPAELFKYGGNELKKHLHTIIKKIWLKEKMPTEWNLSIICLIHKKGDTMECSNYRAVSLLNMAYKIPSNILLARISPFAENIIRNYQCGFWKNLLPAWPVRPPWRKVVVLTRDVTCTRSCSYSLMYS